MVKENLNKLLLVLIVVTLTNHSLHSISNTDAPLDPLVLNNNQNKDIVHKELCLKLDKNNREQWDYLIKKQVLFFTASLKDYCKLVVEGDFFKIIVNPYKYNDLYSITTEIPANEQKLRLTRSSSVPGVICEFIEELEKTQPLAINIPKIEVPAVQPSRTVTIALKQENCAKTKSLPCRNYSEIMQKTKQWLLNSKTIACATVINTMLIAYLLYKTH